MSETIGDPLGLPGLAALGIGGNRHATGQAIGIDVGTRRGNLRGKPSGGHVGKVSGIGLDAIDFISGFEDAFEGGPCLLGTGEQAPVTAGLGVDAQVFQDGESGASHGFHSDFVMADGEFSELFLTGPKAREGQAVVPGVLELLGVGNQFIIGDIRILSEQMLHEHPGINIGKQHDGMFEARIMGGGDMVKEELKESLLGVVDFVVFSEGCRVVVTSFSNGSSCGVGRGSRHKTRMNGSNPRDSARQGGKLGRGHDCTNDASGATSEMGLVRASCSIELLLNNSNGRCSGAFLTNGVHGVGWFDSNVSHGNEIKIARD